jgi:hypothetical protein
MTIVDRMPFYARMLPAWLFRKKMDATGENQLSRKWPGSMIGRAEKPYFFQFQKKCQKEISDVSTNSNR